MKKSIFVLITVIFIVSGCRTSDTGKRRAGRQPKHATPPAALAVPQFIDAHNHLHGGPQENYRGAAMAAIKKMDQLGIARMIIMPPPGSPGHQGGAPMTKLLPVVSRYPDRFMVLGGGSVLNQMILKEKDRKHISPALEKRFRAKALDILEKGAVGFGEFAAEHFSFSTTHPYESVSPDHPLFLLLADIAAKHDVPIDIHMEAIPENMPFPRSPFLNKSNRNPATLQANIPAFERFLSHNPDARIIWAHVGWCNTGKRTAALCRTLFEKHPNLYMSVKIAPEGLPSCRPFDVEQNRIKPEWLSLMNDFDDRFIIGTDQFYAPPGSKQIGPQKTEAIIHFISLLPEDLARKFCAENPRRVFRL